VEVVDLGIYLIYRVLVSFCKNFECDASPKAAKKLEKLGFDHVVDYEVGIEG